MRASQGCSYAAELFLFDLDAGKANKQRIVGRKKAITVAQHSTAASTRGTLPRKSKPGILPD
jgi:hypothetical protein